MLLRFGVENFLSIKERQELSLTAATLKHNSESLIECGTASGRRALPAAIIYGANASGKTNLLEAFRFMQGAIVLSHRKGNPDGGVPRTHFKLDPSCFEAPSTFDIDFVVDGVRYHYGFEANDDIFVSEWLHSFPLGRQRTLFERTGQDFEFKSLKGRKEVIADITRPNSLFLSAAAQNDHEEISPLVSMISSFQGRIYSGVNQNPMARLTKNEKYDNLIVRFLDSVGTGIVDIRRKEIEPPQEDLNFRKAFAKALRDTGQEPAEFNPLEDEKYVRIEFAHRGSAGRDIYLDMASESAGTRKLFLLLSPVFRALESGSPIFVDEIDSSLHTKACEAVLSLFCSKETNPKGAQLVVTTHNTNLLRAPFLRRDQIWFTEKDEEGATHLYPLTDFRGRDSDNFAKGYLQGRFGALPFAGPVPDFADAE